MGDKRRSVKYFVRRKVCELRSKLVHRVATGDESVGSVGVETFFVSGVSLHDRSAQLARVALIVPRRDREFVAARSGVWRESSTLENVSRPECVSSEPICNRQTLCKEQRKLERAVRSGVANATESARDERQKEARTVVCVCMCVSVFGCVRRARKAAVGSVFGV